MALPSAIFALEEGAVFASKIRLIVFSVAELPATANVAAGPESALGGLSGVEAMHTIGRQGS